MTGFKHWIIYFFAYIVMCSIAGAGTVDLHVENTVGNPVQDAYVWMGPHTAAFARTDFNGDALLENDFITNYMLVVRHRLYGRTSPAYINLASDTNLTLVLPPLTHVRIASYNMEGNRNSGEWDASQILPLARVFWTVQPDIVLLQECPGSGLLFTEFQERFMPGYASAESTEGFYIHNGICSFYPIEDSYSEGATVMTRDLFVTEININNIMSFTCLSSHYKAGSETSDRERRNQEAAYTGIYCSNLHAASTEFIFGGDLNDDPLYPRPPADVFGILNGSGADFVTLDPRDDNGSSVTIPVINRRYDYLMPVSSVADDEVNAAVFRTETMAVLPAWLDRDDCELASDHRMIYADIAVIPEPGSLLIIVICLACSRNYLSGKSDISGCAF